MWKKVSTCLATCMYLSFKDGLHQPVEYLRAAAEHINIDLNILGLHNTTFF